MPVSEPSYDDLTPTGAMGGLRAIASQCPEHGAFIHAVCTGPLAEVERLREALGSALGYVSADIDSDDPSTDNAYVLCQQIRDALNAS